MQCSHKKRDGKRCRASALTDNTNCSLHAQPGRAAELGSKGGRRRAIHDSGDLREFAAPKTAGDLRELLAESIVEIRARNPPQPMPFKFKGDVECPKNNIRFVPLYSYAHPASRRPACRL